MKYDLTDLLEVFDELLPSTDEEKRVYFLEYYREDGIIIQLSFSAFEGSAGIIVRLSEKVSPAYVNLINCTNIRVLDLHRKIVEVIASKDKNMNVRLLIALQGESILFIEAQ